jgi:hypothetical protein
MWKSSDFRGRCCKILIALEMDPSLRRFLFSFPCIQYIETDGGNRQISRVFPCGVVSGRCVVLAGLRAGLASCEEIQGFFASLRMTAWGVEGF